MATTAWGDSFGSAWGHSFDAGVTPPVVVVVEQPGGGDDDVRVQRGGYREPPQRFRRELHESIKARIPRYRREEVLQAVEEITQGRTIVKRRSEYLPQAETEMEERQLVQILIAADIL